MPFTLSHAAVALAFWRVHRKYISLTGLAVGSMSPDFEYLLRLQMKGEFGHSPGGILWFCLPMSLLVAVLYHRFVKFPLIMSMPDAIRNRLARYVGMDWMSYLVQHYPVVIVSILIGAGSHIYLDALTHETGIFVQSFSALQEPVMLGNFGLPVYKLLQYSFGVIGLLLLLIGLWSLPAQRTKAYKYATQFISYTILLTVFFLGVRILYGMDFTKLVNWIINIMALGSLSILLVAILHYFSLRPKAKH